MALCSLDGFQEHFEELCSCFLAKPSLASRVLGLPAIEDAINP